MAANVSGVVITSSPGPIPAAKAAAWSAAVPLLTRRFGAQVEKFMGDGMMATFNSRGDQPDHAVRAAGAALALGGCRHLRRGKLVAKPDDLRVFVGVVAARHRQLTLELHDADGRRRGGPRAPLPRPRPAAAPGDPQAPRPSACARRLAPSSTATAERVVSTRERANMGWKNTNSKTSTASTRRQISATR